MGSTTDRAQEARLTRLLLAGVVLAGLWFAAPVYVDGDAKCPGDGTSETPYCSLQAVRDNDPFEPGTEYLIRDAEEPYTDVDNVVTFNRDGTEDEPLTLAPDVGHSPILRHAIELANCSHWVVRGLTERESTGALPSRSLPGIPSKRTLPSKTTRYGTGKGRQPSQRRSTCGWVPTVRSLQRRFRA